MDDHVSAKWKLRQQRIMHSQAAHEQNIVNVLNAEKLLQSQFSTGGGWGTSHTAYWAAPDLGSATGQSSRDHEGALEYRETQMTQANLWILPTTLLLTLGLPMALSLDEDR